MTSNVKFFIERDHSVIHHDCFYQLINACAAKHGLEGRATYNEHGAYVLTLRGPTVAIENFMDFMHFINGAVGRIVLITPESGGVPEFQQRPASNPSPQDDADPTNKVSSRKSKRPSV